MAKRYVIKSKFLPTYPPTTFGLVLWLLLDRFHAAGWVHGICWTLFGICWVASLYVRFFEDVDVHPTEIPK